MNKKTTLAFIFLIINTLLVGQFVQTSVGNNFDVKSLSADASKVYVLANNQVFVSSDFGASYASISNTPSMFTYNLVKYDNQSNHLYLATEGNPVISTLASLLVSTDGGNLWNTVSLPLLNSSKISAIEINGSNIYIGTNSDGLLFSNDGGASWVKKNNGLPKFYADTTVYEEITEIFINNTGDILLGTYRDGLYKMASGDTMFNASNSNVGKNGSGVYSPVGDIFYNNGRYFRGLVNDSYYFSDNNMQMNYYYTEFFSSNGLKIEFVELNGSIYCTVENYVYYSVDNGVTWKKINQYFASGITSITRNDYNIIIGTKSEGAWVYQIVATDIEKITTKDVEVKVYPNPSSDYISIDISNSKLANDFGTYIEVMSVNGQVLNVFETNSSEIFQLDVSNYEKGTYIIRVSNSNFSFYKTKQFTVN